MEQTSPDTKYAIEFMGKFIPFSNRLKSYREAKRFMALLESRKGKAPVEPAIESLTIILDYLSDELSLDYVPRILAGRLANGAERDHGNIVHAVGNSGGVAICGTSPGRRSGGWVPVHCGDDAITCPKCLRRIDQIKAIRGEK